MDPDANLREQRELAARLIDDYNNPESNGIDQDDAAQLAELVQALDEWIKGGGFLPYAWTTATPTHGRARCNATQTDTDHTYTCRLPAGHAGDHVDIRNPMHPTWKATR